MERQALGRPMRCVYCLLKLDCLNQLQGACVGETPLVLHHLASFPLVLEDQKIHQYWVWLTHRS